MAKITAGRYLNRLTERIEQRRKEGASPDEIAWYAHAAKQMLPLDRLPLSSEERAALDRYFPEPDTEAAYQARCEYQERQLAQTEGEDDYEAEDLMKKAAELVEFAAELSDGDFGEMMSLLTLAAASATMIPFNNAETSEASAARIASRTTDDEEMIDAAIDLFVASYRDVADGTARDMAMTFAIESASPMLRHVNHSARTGGSVVVSFRGLPGGTYMAVETNQETGETISELGPLTANEVQELTRQLEHKARKAGKPFTIVDRAG